MKFDAVIFDCDGVLVDSEVLAIRGERKALKEMGLEYTTPDYVRRFVGLHDGVFIEQLRIDYRNAFGAAAPDDFEDRITAGRRNEMGALTVIAGAGAAMEAAKEKTGAIAVASSARALFLESKLKRMGLWGHAAPHIYSADLVVNGKPAPDVFLYAADKLSVDPARCLVLEDSENGVRAGRAAGMTVWGFLGGGHVYDGHAERLCEAGAHDNVEDFISFQQRLDAT